VVQGRTGCQFNGRPVLSKKIIRVMIVRRIYSNAAGFPAGSVRDLKIENEGYWFLGFILVIAAHSVSPLFCVELAHLGLGIGLS
jgi:hypothetical protein